MKNFYVTTPIYYVNDAPHIGHSYTTVLADILTRFHKILGYQTFFLTGTDEHGQKVQRAAAKREVDPQAHVDEYYHHFEDLWKKMGICNDFFIRTTYPEHKAYVQECLQKLWDKGEIYSKEYEGWYSVGEERFFGEDELDENKCDPISHRPVEWLKEKNYFFKMSKYQQQLIDHLNANPDWIVPDYRRNEILGFLRQPLNDLCISRPKARLSWGIPLPFDNDYVTYVWFDALLNYVSASTAFHKTFADGTPIWPATYHLIGKDILTTHSVYWPTMLMALDIPLPKHILAHGWWLVNGGEKMSKSAGNVVKPMDYMEKYGDDAFRYYLAREMVVGQDANFTHDSFVRRINADLANDLGNVLNRVHKLVLTNFEGKLPAAVVMDDAANDVMNLAKKVIEDIKQDLPQARLSQSIENIMSLVRSINRYFEIKAPWKLAKDPALKDELATVLYVAAEAVRLSLCMLWPVIPTKAEEGLKMLGTKFESAEDLVWGLMKGGEAFGEGKPLFPRIEEEVKPQQQQQQQKPKQNKPLTAADVPAAMDLRAAKIVEVADHPDATSLYVLKVDAGEGELRTVCSGLKASYEASELKDRMILLFANLKPAPLRGIMSAGMLFAGDLEAESHKCRLVAVPEGAKPGDRALFKGVQPSEPRELKLKDFDKIALSVKNGEVFCTAGEGAAPIALEIDGKAVTCDVPEGNGVH